MNNYKFVDRGRTHAHFLGDRELTGVSSVLKVISKPLTYWSAELAAVECLESGEKIPTIREEYKAAIEGGNKKQAIDELQRKYPIFEKARFAHKDSLEESADKGTDVHSEIESFVKWIIEIGGEPITTTARGDKAAIFSQWAQKSIRKFLWSELYCFSEHHFLGGISDIGAEMKDGSIAVIDIKSSREAYPTQFWQISGYDLLISENGGYTKDGEKIFTLPKPITQHIVFPFGAVEPKGIVRFDVEQNKSAFLHCLAIYRQLGNYEK